MTTEGHLDARGIAADGLSHAVGENQAAIAGGGCVAQGYAADGVDLGGIRADHRCDVAQCQFGALDLGLQGKDHGDAGDQKTCECDHL